MTPHFSLLPLNGWLCAAKVDELERVRQFYSDRAAV